MTSMSKASVLDSHTLGHVPAPARNSWSSWARSRTAIWLYRALLIASLLALWEVAVKAKWVNPLFLAAPSDVIETLIAQVAIGSIWVHIGETLTATAIGFALGTIVGATLGFFIGLSPTLTAVASPIIAMLNSLPRIALAPLFVVWFGIGTTSGVVLVFTLVVFIILMNTIAGTQDVDQDHLTLAKLSSARKGQIIMKIALPSVLPWILAGMRLSFAYGLAGAVVGEMFVGQRGLGYLIVAGAGVFNVAQIFAALSVTVLIAFLADVVFAVVERRSMRWRR